MYQIGIKRRTGREQFTGINCTLLDYWIWAHSDIDSNAERGKLAEFIVKSAVHADSPFRVEWDEVDVVSPEGIKIEVKSSAYLQTWKRNKLSTIQFDIAPKKIWDSETGFYSETKQRNADVYVFCLFACQKVEVADPLDMKQWEFYVIGTGILDEKVPEQKSIGLKSLLNLGAKKVSFGEIYSAVRDAVK